MKKFFPRTPFSKTFRKNKRGFFVIKMKKTLFLYVRKATARVILSVGGGTPPKSNAERVASQMRRNLGREERNDYCTHPFSLPPLQIFKKHGRIIYVFYHGDGSNFFVQAKWCLPLFNDLTSGVGDNFDYYLVCIFIVIVMLQLF